MKPQVCFFLKTFFYLNFFVILQTDHSADTVELGNDGSIQWVSHLLDLSPGWLQQAITMKVTVRIQQNKATEIYQQLKMFQNICNM